MVILEECELWKIPFEVDSLQHLRHGLPNTESLPVTTINCLALGMDPCKMPRLIAHLECAEADIVHFQRLGQVLAPPWMRGLQCIMEWGPPF